LLKPLKKLWQNPNNKSCDLLAACRLKMTVEVISLKKYILALDQGTTSSKALVVDSDGKIICKVQFEFPQIYPKPGWVEHDPMDILETELSAMSKAVSQSGISVSDIASIGITNQRETTVVWDRITGKPVYNAIVWQCRRTADICLELANNGFENYIRETTGLLIDAYFSATKIKWILDNVKGAREKANRGNLLFGTIDTWLIWNLTKGKVHITDYSNASRTMLFDINTLKWDEKLCNKFSIPMSMLPEVKPSSCVYGVVAEGIAGIEKFSGIPIASAIGDQPAALFGQACYKKGQMKCTYGTGCFLLLNTGGENIRSQHNLVSSVAWGLNGKVTYALEGSVFNAGSVIKWLRDSLMLIGSAKECDILAEIVEDTAGVYFVPAFTGLGAPYWDMFARGLMIGLTRGCTKAHIARAALESIAYQVTDLAKVMQEEVSYGFKELRVDGGASVSNVMLQFQSDIMNLPVNRAKNIETTALGAAHLAGLATGVFINTDELFAYREADRVFLPDMQEEKRKNLYGGWKRAVSRSMNWAINSESN
jgi:glycerol kinase